MRILAALSICLALAAPARAASKDEVRKILKKNPDIVLEVLRENKKELFDIVNEAARDEQARRQKEAAAEAERELEAAISDPYEPSIGPMDIIRGDRYAKHTLVEYSDFQCPYCKRGTETVEALREKYGNDLRVVYKHFPLSFHPEAMPAAKYMQAIALQDAGKAWEFHDAMFENQGKLGDAFYKETAKKLGVDMKKLAKDLESAKVKEKIESDIREAKKFGFTGTPGFLMNGVPVRGAYPPQYFTMILEKLANN